MSELFSALEDMRKAQEEYLNEYNAKAKNWWNNLPIEERELAFYYIVSKIYEGELVEQGTYRYILYDVFGFGPEMYGLGMDCGFMALHNAIYTNEEIKALKEKNNIRNQD